MFDVNCVLGLHSMTAGDHVLEWPPRWKLGPQVIGQVGISLRGQKAFLGIRNSMPKYQSPESTKVFRGEVTYEGC